MISLQSNDDWSAAAAKRVSTRVSAHVLYSISREGILAEKVSSLCEAVFSRPSPHGPTAAEKNWR